MQAHLSVDDAYILPELGVVYEVTLLLPHPTQQLIKACTIVELVKKMDEEVYISRSVNEMSTGTLKLWFPDLQGHSLCEDLLRKLMLGTHSCCNVLMVIVDNMRSLERSQSTPTGRAPQMIIPLQ